MEYIVMISTGSITMDCHDICGCHTDYDEPIVGFISLLSLMECALMAWSVWLSDDTSLRHMAWPKWCPSWWQSLLGDELSSVSQQGGSSAICLNRSCMCIFVWGFFCIVSNAYHLVDLHGSAWFRPRWVHGICSLSHFGQLTQCW